MPSDLDTVLYNHLPDITDVEHIKLRKDLQRLIDQAVITELKKVDPIAPHEVSEIVADRIEKLEARLKHPGGGKG